MQTATRPRTSTYTPQDGSRTLTTTNVPTREEVDEREVNPQGSQVVGSLRLRGGPRKYRQQVAWNENVVDNEGSGKKKSKMCCIYHKPRRFDESSDESSDSESDSDARCTRDHDHAGHNHEPTAGPSSSGQQARPDTTSSTVHELEHHEDDEPNAYEKQPSSKKGKHRAT